MFHQEFLSSQAIVLEGDSRIFEVTEGVAPFFRCQRLENSFPRIGKDVLAQGFCTWHPFYRVVRAASTEWGGGNQEIFVV